MKKLKKSNLDELAKEMPVLSEKNQHECVGGACYVSANGMYFGQINDGDRIKIVTSSEWSGVQFDNTEDNNITSYLSDATAIEKKAVFSGMAHLSSYDPDEISLVSQNSNGGTGNQEVYVSSEQIGQTAIITKLNFNTWGDVYNYNALTSKISNAHPEEWDDITGDITGDIIP